MSEKAKEVKVTEVEVKKETKPKATPKPKPKATKKPTKTQAEKAVEKITQTVSKPATKQQRDMNEMVSVICITNSPLIYESKSQMGYRIDWDGYLSENWIEYKELINMRNSQRAFFEEPWVICEWDVLQDLKVTQYYKNLIDLENLEDVFKKPIDELEKTLKIVPKGIKHLIVDKAYELRKSRELDSISVIEIIENTLNVDLTI